MPIKETITDAAESISRIKHDLEIAIAEIQASNADQAKKEVAITQLGKITSSLKCLAIDANVLVEYLSNTKAFSLIDQSGNIRQSTQMERYMICQRQYFRKEGIRFEDL